METPEGNSRRSWPGPQRRPGSRGTAGGTRATVLGSLTIPRRPEQVATAPAFGSRTPGRAPPAPARPRAAAGGARTPRGGRGGPPPAGPPRAGAAGQGGGGGGGAPPEPAEPASAPA